MAVRFTDEPNFIEFLINNPTYLDWLYLNEEHYDNKELGLYLMKELIKQNKFTLNI